MCQSYVSALRIDVPAACRQLARPKSCPVSCVAPVQPPATCGIKPPEPVPRRARDAEPTPDRGQPRIQTQDIQVGDKQYTKVAGLGWIQKKPDRFADVSVGPNELQSKPKPSPLPRKTEGAERVKSNSAPHGYDRAPQPLQGFIDTVMLPFDFLAYPGRRDW